MGDTGPPIGTFVAQATRFGIRHPSVICAAEYGHETFKVFLRGHD